MGGFPPLMFCVRRLAFWGAVFAIVVGCATPASADSLAIPATGSINSTCSIALASSFPSANFAVSASVGATATLNCNTRFKVNATSTNGAIRTLKSPPTGFTNALAYSLSVNVPLDQGGSVSATCAAAQLIAGQAGCALSPANSTGLSSGPGTSINKTAALTVAWTLPATKLIVGSYFDTITISVAPQP